MVTTKEDRPITGDPKEIERLQELENMIIRFAGIKPSTIPNSTDKGRLLELELMAKSFRRGLKFFSRRFGGFCGSAKRTEEESLRIIRETGLAEDEESSRHVLDYLCKNRIGTAPVVLQRIVKAGQPMVPHLHFPKSKTFGILRQSNSQGNTYYTTSWHKTYTDGGMGSLTI